MRSRPHKKMGDGSQLDPAICDRVTEQIDDFKRALQEADDSPSVAARDKLRQTADSLMRAVAAVMITLAGIR